MRRVPQVVCAYVLTRDVHLLERYNAVLHRIPFYVTSKHLPRFVASFGHTVDACRFQHQGAVARCFPSFHDGDTVSAGRISAS